MHKNLWLSMALLSTSAFAAEQFTGSQPMLCTPHRGFDCLPSEKSCTPLQPEAGKTLDMLFDVQKMSVKTPYRNDTLAISTFAFNTKSLVLQGTSLELVWSATIHRTTGRLTIAIADREGAYIVFGDCKLASAAPAAKQ